MGSSSSSTAAAAAAAATNSHSLLHANASNPYHQQYYGNRTTNEFQNRYFDEYCYAGAGANSGGGGGGSGGAGLPPVSSQIQSGSSRDLFHQQQQQQSQHSHHHHHHQTQVMAAAQLPPQPSCSSSNANKHEKKKKWWKRRSSRSSDPGQPLRELLANWSLGEVVALVHEYETMTNEKELYIHAESSRPRAPTLRSDLADLLDFKWNSDVNLILPPAIFPAHRAILMQRSKYFRNLLNSSNSTTNTTSNGSIVNVNVEDTSVDIPTFSGLLRFLYTEEIPSASQSQSSQQHQQQDGPGADSHHHSHHHHAIGTIVRPSKPLESDLRDVLQSGKYSDIVLVLGDEQYNVHKAILAARSPFFRSLLQRRSNSKKIVLDDTVIPKRYARVILTCMYTDKLDLTLIESSRSGLTEVESLTFTGKVNPSGFEEAMELYQIGRFLEFDHLCVCSEDIITEQLTHDSLPQILRWSFQSHGSSWVRRQALMYVQEEYLSLISTASFLELDKHTLLEVVQSDFLQASEVEVLNSIIKWGEHQLIKRVEDREPNLVSSTRDSVFRNNNSKSKRRGGGNAAAGANYASDLHLNDSELREIVFELIRCVRTDHIPLSNESLVAAVRRGLVSIPPTHMITEEKVNPWVNNLQCPNYIRPRLYTPYYEEAKSALRQRTGANSNANNSSSTECLGGGNSGAGSGATHFQSSSSHLAYLNSIGRIKTLRPIIPDTLYMIENDHHHGNLYSHHHHHHHHHHHGYSHEKQEQSEGDGGAGTRDDDCNKRGDKGGGGGGGGGVGDHPEQAQTHHQDTGKSGGVGPIASTGGSAVDELVVDQELLNAMLYREKKLRSAHLRNLSNPISRERATRYIRLRVVREFGYPDYVAELLDHHNRASLNQAGPAASTSSTNLTSTTTSSVTTQTSTNNTTTNTTTIGGGGGGGNSSSSSHHDDYELLSGPGSKSLTNNTTSASREGLSSSSNNNSSSALTSSTATRSPVHHHHPGIIGSSYLGTTSSAPPPPPPEFHSTTANMPDVALNTNDTDTIVRSSGGVAGGEQQRNAAEHREDALMIPLLDLDLGDSNLGGITPSGPPNNNNNNNNNSGGAGSSIRTRSSSSNRNSFGSLSRAAASATSTQSLVRLQQQQQQQHHPQLTSAACYAGTLPHGPSCTSQQQQQQLHYHGRAIQQQYGQLQYSVYQQPRVYGLSSTAPPPSSQLTSSSTSSSSSNPHHHAQQQLQQQLHHHVASSHSSLTLHHPSRGNCSRDQYVTAAAATLGGSADPSQHHAPLLPPPPQQQSSSSSSSTLRHHHQQHHHHHGVVATPHSSSSSSSTSRSMQQQMKQSAQGSSQQQHHHPSHYL